MDNDKKIKNCKVKKNECLSNLEIQDTTLDTEASEENPGIGYEILTIKVNGNP
jgi:hypothetical protein